MAATAKPLDLVELRVDDAVASLRFRRAAHLNAYSGQMLDEIEWRLRPPKPTTQSASS